MSSDQVDVRPLAAPANPFAHLAAIFRTGDAAYPTPEVRAQMAALAEWLEWLGMATPEVAHVDPILLLAAGKAGVDAKARRWLQEACARVDELASGAKS